MRHAQHNDILYLFDLCILMLRTYQSTQMLSKCLLNKEEKVQINE